MLHFSRIDLSCDPLAGRYVKEETVSVAFAREAGELISLEGPNRYAPGDAIITGSTGSRWVVSHDRFVLKYDPVAPLQAGKDGAYRAKPVPVFARQIHEPFSIARSAGGDVLQGKAQDWLLQYAPGDYGLAENQRFVQVYRRLPESDGV
ncbi:hypothetical protein HCX48_09660 [Rhodocyclus tenuis]|uniref:PGDYG protein n=1 Tax=Rhodocyclus gracilis TaxID=2929842 RepID=A0ABX0WID9_9RHOO|nr:PGDYG domain-containing protein [Rhodocyclus gracilis]MRD72428.1 hypothetical protein [Rhodocyclus gracilis]NJA89486.1 hypothetical protein [Rhodocyclus gracilis]